MIRPGHNAETRRRLLSTRSEIEERFSGLPAIVIDWLASQPSIVHLLSQAEREFQNDVVSRDDLIGLLKRWSEGLPARRGVLLNLVAQLELPMELAPGRGPRRQTRSNTRGKRQKGSLLR